MKKLKYLVMAGLLLLAACGPSYEESKRQAREQQRQLMREDSAALKVAVMPTIDCLPLYVAQELHLYDSTLVEVRLKRYTAQMDCDTALERGRVEGMVTDLVRAVRIARKGTPLRYVAVTNAYWQLITNRNARIKQLKQLDDKMLAMTRYSATDMLADRAIDSARLQEERVFKVQINDVNVRMDMLKNNELDAFFFTEPQATAARLLKNPVVMDSRQLDVQLGVMVFREKEMQRQARSQQQQAFLKGYNAACDSLNRYGIHHYRDIIVRYCGVTEQVADSLPDHFHFPHAAGPRQQDMDAAGKWLDKKP